MILLRLNGVQVLQYTSSRTDIFLTISQPPGKIICTSSQITLKLFPYLTFRLIVTSYPDLHSMAHSRTLLPVHSWGFMLKSNSFEIGLNLTSILIVLLSEHSVRRYERSIAAYAMPSRAPARSHEELFLLTSILYFIVQ